MARAGLQVAYIVSFTVRIWSSLPFRNITWCTPSYAPRLTHPLLVHAEYN